MDPQFLTITSVAQLAFNAPEPPPPNEMPSGIFRVRKYKDPHYMQYFPGVEDTNFSAIKLASFSIKGANNTLYADFNDVAKFQVVDGGFLRLLQFEEPEFYGTVDRKMRWLCNYDEDAFARRPYWFVAPQYRFGTILFGGNVVKVKTDAFGEPKVFWADCKFGLFKFYQVDGMPQQLEKEIAVAAVSDPFAGLKAHEMYPWYVPNCTAIEGGVHTELPRGVTHLHCVWDDGRYPTNYGDGKNYIAAEFLEARIS